MRTDNATLGDTGILDVRDCCFDMASRLDARARGRSSLWILEPDLRKLPRLVAKLLSAVRILVHHQEIRDEVHVYLISQSARIVCRHCCFEDRKQVSDGAVLPALGEGLADQRGGELVATQVFQVTQGTRFLISGGAAFG